MISLWSVFFFYEMRKIVLLTRHNDDDKIRVKTPNPYVICCVKILCWTFLITRLTEMVIDCKYEVNNNQTDSNC